MIPSSRPRPREEPVSRLRTESVSTIMSRDLAIVPDTLELDLLTKYLLEHRLSCAAVSDASGALVGYVSMSDLVRDRYINGDTESCSPVRRRAQRRFNGAFGSGFHLEMTKGTTAGDIMMPFVVRLSESASIDQAAALMASEGVHRVVIVSESQKVLGIVSALDVLRSLAERDGCSVARSTKARWRHSCEYATT